MLPWDINAHRTIFGDVVSFYARVLREGRTSVIVQATVEAERSQEPRQCIKVTEAEVV